MFEDQKPATNSQELHQDNPCPSVAILAQAISCSNVHGVLLVHERFWFCLVQVATTRFCSFPLVPTAGVGDGSGVLISLMPGTSSNYGSPNGSGPDLDGMGHRSIDAQFKELRDILSPLARGFANFDNHVKTLSEAVGMVTSRIASVEQTVNALSAKMASFAALEQNVSTLTENVNSLTARMCKIETNAVSVSSGSDSARSWNILGHSDGSTAAGSHGSHGQGLLTAETRGGRLDTFSSPKMNRHEVPSYYGSHANNTQRGYDSPFCWEKID